MKWSKEKRMKTRGKNTKQQQKVKDKLKNK